MIKSNKTKKSKSSRKNPRMPTQGNKIEEKFGLELDAIAENIRKTHADYIEKYALWLSSKQEKKLKTIMSDLYKLAAELE